jgi:hypothetical protein
LQSCGRVFRFKYVALSRSIVRRLADLRLSHGHACGLCNHCDYNSTDKCFETVYTKTIRLRKSSVEDAQSRIVPRVGEPGNAPIGAILVMALFLVFSAPQTLLAFSDIF